jgi:parvulin-like peptidyl-prolyl isomerase
MKPTRPVFILMMLAALSIGATADEHAAELVLVEVNGEPITGADLDEMIMEAHSGGSMDSGFIEGLVPRLLEKAVRDRLILQDAFAIGMGEESSIVREVDERVARRMISLYSRAQVDLPEITEEEKEQFFRDYYHKIQVRQLSLPTEEECRAAVQRIQGGEITMGTLAVESSMDTQKARGGLHNDKYWADVENRIRDAVRGLDPGEFSDPFPYNDVWSVVRVESRTPPNPDDYPRFENYIHAVLRNQKYEAVWAELVADHEARVEVTEDRALLDAMLEDEGVLYRADFKIGSEAPVLAIDADHAVTDRQFRKAMQHLAMEMGTSTIREIQEQTIAQEREQLVLAWSAEKEGWLENPEVVEYRQKQLEEIVLNTYLEEYIHQNISVPREDLEAYYEEHKGEYRGAEEVRLSILTTSDQEVIQEAIQRIRDGADFDYVRAEIEGREVEALTASEAWSPITMFSQVIRDAVAELDVGGISEPLPFARSWMILRLDGRREGSVLPLRDVESQIRKALYMREFTRLLDEHLARLEEASEIVWHEDRIQDWAQSES